MKKLALLLDCCRNEKPDHPFWHYAFCGNERVFGVAAEDMECGYDSRGNSVPCILLRMQERLYQTGALKVEGIFRINPEITLEESIRDQLKRGIVPANVDCHCLAGLIKAWFRELPEAILDVLTPEQVADCQNEEDCIALLKLLPPMKASLLDWAVNLMTDVTQEKHMNMMNARNIAMVFAPNMTQVGDAMTALLHVVEVMKFLEMLILRNLRKRVEVAASDLQQADSLDFEVGPNILKDAEIPEGDSGGVVLLDGLERQSSGPIDNNLLMDFEYYNSNNPTVVVKKHSRRRRAKKGRVHQNGTDTDNGNVESWYT
ncbi:unnamed protein product [Sphagnum balticum]